MISIDTSLFFHTSRISPLSATFEELEYPFNKPVSKVSLVFKLKLTHPMFPFKEVLFFPLFDFLYRLSFFAIQFPLLRVGLKNSKA